MAESANGHGDPARPVDRLLQHARDDLPRVQPATHPDPFSLTARAAHGCDDVLYGAGAQFQLRLAAGPALDDCPVAHAGETWFWQLQGDATLRLLDGGQWRDVVVRDGECYLLAPGVPHAVQRLPGSIGLTLERARSEGELDAAQWYCVGCGAKLSEQRFAYGDGNDAARRAAIDACARAATAQPCPSCGAAQQRGPPAALKDAAGVPSDKADAPRIDEGTHPPPQSFMDWIQKHRPTLKPPVGNKLMYGRGCELQVMIVAGPNTRTDYHVEEGEEWFYMVEGAMTLKILDGGAARDIHIGEGESFLLPACVPHSPQRFPNTIGLVIERQRHESEKDHMAWYCRASGCGAKIFDASFHCKDLGVQVKECIESYYGDASLRRCARCGTVDERLV